MRATASPDRSAIFLDAALFVALLSTALALGGALAHLFEMPTKMTLNRGSYFIVQGIYRGWDRLAFVLVAQALSILTLAALARRDFRLRLAGGLAFAFLAGAQALFWTLTYPANVATENWTSIPENWDMLRRQWEYSHAGGAVLQMLAMCALICAALIRTR